MRTQRLPLSDGHVALNAFGTVVSLREEMRARGAYTAAHSLFKREQKEKPAAGKRPERIFGIRISPEGRRSTVIPLVIARWFPTTFTREKFLSLQFLDGLDCKSRILYSRPNDGIFDTAHRVFYLRRRETEPSERIEEMRKKKRRKIRDGSHKSSSA